MVDYSIIIPVYNGEDTVIPLFEKIKEFFNKHTFTYEVIFVYDCGPDKSWEALCTLKNNYPENIKLIKLSRNYGQHNALICGFQYADSQFVITMDEDLQHHPEDIITLIKKQSEKDYDVVYGKYKELKHNFYRNFTSQIFKKVIKKGIPELHNDYSAYRLIKTSVAKATIEMQNSYTFLDGYLTWITKNCGSCEVIHYERLSGKSSYTFKKLLNHSINIFVTFSNLPIRIVTFLSVFTFLITIIYGSYIIIRKLIYEDLAVGYPSLIITIGLGVSIIMFGLGIIGEYIYRINLKTTKRPNYKVDKIL